MTNPNISELSRELARLAGFCWHEYRGKIGHESLCGCGFLFDSKSDVTRHAKKSNPDFSDAREVIRVMREIGKMDKFLDYFSVDLGGKWAKEFINDYIPDTTGLLLQEAVMFMRKEAKDERT